jgi:hypothetical protein
MDGAAIGSTGDVRLAFYSYSAGVAAHGMFVWWFYWFTVRGVLRRHPWAVTGALASCTGYFFSLHVRGRPSFAML